MTTRTMAPGVGPTVRPRPVPWRRLAWVTLRQRRGVLIGGGILLGVFAVYMVIMAVIQNNAYAAVAACHPAAALKCQQLNNSFYRSYWGGGAGRVIQSGGAQTVSSLLFAVPLLLGVFLGAPALSRELETGTFRFAWTQGAGRTRWTLSTLVLPAVVVTAATGAFTAIFWWYFKPFLEDQQVSEMLPLAFALLGVAFAAWTLLAYSLAAFLGALFRRTVPAMAVTLVVYIVLAIATATAIRPHYATPVTVRGWNNSSAWVISQWVKAPDGHVLTQSALTSVSQSLPASVQNSSDPNAFTNWMAQHGYTTWQSVQPDSRFWQFQLTEGGWLLVVSAALIAGTVWLVRRRGALHLGLGGRPASGGTRHDTSVRAGPQAPQPPQPPRLWPVGCAETARRAAGPPGSAVRLWRSSSASSSSRLLLAGFARLALARVDAAPAGQLIAPYPMISRVLRRRSPIASEVAASRVGPEV